MTRHLLWILLSAVSVLAEKHESSLRGLRTANRGGQNSQTVRDIIQGAISDRKVLLDGSSYQSKALLWSQKSSMGMSKERVLQRYALACIYYATYEVPTTWSAAEGAVGAWTDETKWMTESNECEGWYGVKCNGDNEVTQIDLANNGLSGSFPVEVVLLKSSLLELDLSNNKIYNDGVGWLGLLTNLEVLLLRHNAMMDRGLPATWKNLINLRSLDVSYCLFAGAIDDGFFNVFPFLEYLELSGNTFDGPIPSSIKDLWSLKFLYMEDSESTGSLDPVLMSGLPVLEEFWADDNPNMSGEISAEVGTLKSLKSLSLVNCNLSGGIPVSIGNLVDMEQLWLSENNLDGNIPEDLGSLVEMTIFYVHDNNLEGSMPSAVCSSSSVTKLGADCHHCPTDCCTCCGARCTNV